MAELGGKIALVTGGARRVGRAIARACADAGAEVAVHYLSSRGPAEELCAEIRGRGRRAEAFSADLTDPGACRGLGDAVLERFGGLDLLVNNAATFVRAPLLGGDDRDFEEAWRISLETNLVAPARLARLFSGSLRERGGAVVNLLDVAGQLAWPGYAQHGAAKAGLEHFTRTLAVALGPEVRVNGVAPGIAVFPEDMPEAQREALVGKTTLKRAGSPEAVARAVVFLASQDYVSGAVLPVDGGWTVPR